MNPEISEMYCTCCGRKGVPIPRNEKMRKSGHLKKLYCIYCKKEQNHVEIRPIYSDYNYNDFQLEMKYHNFNENGNRIIPFRIFRGNLRKEGVV